MDQPVHHPLMRTQSDAATHPLDPLSAEEIARAMQIIQTNFPWGPDLRVETIDIEEPAKEIARNHVPGVPFSRIARFQHLSARRDGRVAG